MTSCRRYVSRLSNGNRPKKSEALEDVLGKQMEDINRLFNLSIGFYEGVPSRYRAQNRF